jgi:hypothetical protein
VEKTASTPAHSQRCGAWSNGKRAASADRGCEHTQPA